MNLDNNKISTYRRSALHEISISQMSDIKIESATLPKTLQYPVSFDEFNSIFNQLPFIDLVNNATSIELGELRNPIIFNNWNNWIFTFNTEVSFTVDSIRSLCAVIPEKSPENLHSLCIHFRHWCQFYVGIFPSFTGTDWRIEYLLFIYNDISKWHQCSW